MSRYEKLVLILPNDAAARLKKLAEQERKTVAAFVANVVDDWLEKRRREARLGKAKLRETPPLAETGISHGKIR